MGKSDKYFRKLMGKMTKTEQIKCPRCGNMKVILKKHSRRCSKCGEDV